MIAPHNDLIVGFELKKGIQAALPSSLSRFIFPKDVLSIYFSLVSGLMSAYVVVSFSIETFAPSAPVADMADLSRSA